MDTLEVTPAYGVDYTSQAAVKQAWADGKDFLIETVGPDWHRYINRQDAEREPSTTVMVRYAGLMKVMVVQQGTR